MVTVCVAISSCLLSFVHHSLRKHISQHTDSQITLLQYLVEVTLTEQTLTGVTVSLASHCYLL